MNMTVKKVAVLGVFSALSVVLVMLVHFPIFPAVGFLEYDPADILILYIAVSMGWKEALLMTLVVSVVQGTTVSAQSGVYGILMHAVATGAYALVTALITGKKKTAGRLLAALAAGSGAMVAVMFFANLVITPLFTGWARSAVLDLMPFILAFNLIKAAINGAAAFALHRPLNAAVGRLKI